MVKLLKKKEEAKYYVKEIVRPNYLTMKAEREKYPEPSAKKKKKKTFLKKLTKQLSSRKILKKGKVEVRIHQKEVASHWDEPSRFFKQEMEDAKNSMFI